MPRQPAVADRFYPGSPSALEEAVNLLLPDDPINKRAATAIVCPHAGYIFSGKLACRTIASAKIPRTIVIIGPNHHGQGQPIALSTTDWHMPHGIVPVNRTITDRLLDASSLFSADETAHQYEHSLEVQIPLLQKFRPDLSIVAITVSHINYQQCEKTASALASIIDEVQDKPLLLASTDMSHYESRQTARYKDRKAIDRILDMDPGGLYRTVFADRISMCGVIPVTITLRTAQLLGADTSELIGYTDSGYVSGDTSQVVGYAGFIIS